MKVPLLHRANEHSTAHAKILFVTLFCSLAFFVIISSLDSLCKDAVPSTETSLGMEPFRRDISHSSSEGTGSFPNTVANSPAVETDMQPFGNQNVAPESPAYSPNSLSILRAAAMVLQDAEPEDYPMQESNEIPGNAGSSQPGPSSNGQNNDNEDEGAGGLGFGPMPNLSTQFPFWNMVKEDVWYKEPCGAEEGRICENEDAHYCGQAMACFDSIAMKMLKLGNVETRRFQNNFHDDEADSDNGSSSQEKVPEEPVVQDQRNMSPHRAQRNMSPHSSMDSPGPSAPSIPVSPMNPWDHERGYWYETKIIFMDYVKGLMASPGQRLWHVSVIPDHGFLIEQDDGKFRIYQSWIHSFSLRYWTNMSIPTSSICDPGEALKSMDGDDELRMSFFGITKTGNQQEIHSARARFGGLQTIIRDHLEMLFDSISYGFILDARAFAPTSVADIRRLIPYTATMERYSTVPFLGKSAVSLIDMYSYRHPFEVKIRFFDL